MKTAIYTEILTFLESYKTENHQVLAERFDITGDFLEEIYEMLDFVEDKGQLRLFDISEIDKEMSGQPFLDILEYDDSPDYGVECVLFLGKEHLGYIVGEYHSEAHFPKFEFQYFSI